MVILKPGLRGGTPPTGDYGTDVEPCATWGEPPVNSLPAAHVDFYTSILPGNLTAAPANGNAEDKVDNTLSPSCPAQLTIVLNLSGEVYNHKMDALQEISEEFRIVKPANSTLGEILQALHTGVYVRLEPG